MANSGMPLDPQAEAPVGRLDAFDHAVRRHRIDPEAIADLLHRLVMGGVHRHPFAAADGLQQAVRGKGDIVAGFVARVGLLMGEGGFDLLGDVLDQAAAQHHVQELLAAADAEHRQVALQTRRGDGGLELGAAVLGADGFMAVVGAEQGRVDVEGPAGDQQGVDAREIGLGLLRLVGQQNRQAAGLDHRGGVVLPHRIPGVFRPAAGKL